MIDCNNCIHLNITEEEQADKRKDHKCLFYKKRVIHNSYNHETKTHDRKLNPCNECCKDNYKNYSDIAELLASKLDMKLHEYQKELIRGMFRSSGVNEKYFETKRK